MCLLTQRRRTTRALFCLASLLVVLVPSLTTGAADTPRQELSRLAQELSMTIDAVIASAEKAEPQNTVLQQRVRDAALAQMKGLQPIASEYQQKVASAKSIGDTELFFGNLRSAVNSALGTARNAVPDAAVSDGLRRLDELMQSLDALYSAED